MTKNRSAQHDAALMQLFLILLSKHQPLSDSNFSKIFTFMVLALLVKCKLCPETLELCTGFCFLYYIVVYQVRIE